MLRNIILSTLVIHFGLILGRLSGFAREAFVAATFGVNADADVALLMLTLPDLLVNLMVGGALGASLIPAFKEMPGSSNRLLSQVMVIFGISSLLIALILSLKSNILVQIFAPGFDVAQASAAAIGLGWVVWLIPLTLLAGVTTAFLHSQERFLIVSLGTVIVNVSIIVGLYLIYVGFGSFFLLAMMVLLGGGIRLLSQLLCIDFRFSMLFQFAPLVVTGRLFTRLLGTVLAGSVLLLMPILARAFSTYYGEGALALINYSSRLVDFPLIVAISVISTSLFPRLSQAYLSDRRKFNLLVQYGSRATMGLSILIAITLVTMSEAYVDLIYDYGNMTRGDLDVVVELVSIGLLGLPFQGCSLFFSMILYSQKNIRMVVFLNFIALIVFASLNFFEILGSDLVGIIKSIVLSYAILFLAQIMLVRASSVSVRSLMLGRDFIFGIVSASVMNVVLLAFLRSLDLGSFMSLVLGCLAGFLSICVLLVFDRRGREVVIDGLLRK